MSLSRIRVEGILERARDGDLVDFEATRQITREFGDDRLGGFVRDKVDRVVDGREHPHLAARRIEEEYEYWERRRREREGA